MHFVKTKREYVIIIVNFILQSISSYLLIFSISLTHRLIVILFVDVLVTALVHSRRCLYIKRWLSRSYSSQTSGRMKKIAIFGATGMTGLCTVEAALKQGLEVRALMRDPSRMPEELLKQVEVVTGDVLVKEDVDKVVEGRDAIVVTLGTRNDLAPTTIMSDGLRNILSSMEKNNVKIVSVCLSTFLFYDKPKVPAMFHGINDDHERMLHLLQGTESLNWIAVMPPHIASTPSGEYSVEIDSSPGRAISKYDLGKFMIECLSNPDYYKQKCGLATKVPAP